MKPNEQQLMEARRVYDLFWESYFQGDEQNFAAILDDDVIAIWTAESEVFSNKVEVVSYVHATRDQVAGRTEIRNRDVRLSVVNQLIQYNEFADLYVLIDAQWTFYSKIRFSTLMREVNGEWKICQQHCSFPDPRVLEGETFALEEIKKENLQLRDAVKRRTHELESKNRELEIEASLERVRTQAMAMRMAEDLPNVCEALFRELHTLGFTGLRNAMINIHDDAKSTFVNYDYSDEIGKSITPLYYSIHPVIEKQIRQIRSSPEAFSETVFAGKDLEDWQEFRRRSGEKDDPRISGISGLYYYFYSIGTGSIGVSTFGPVAGEQLDLLKRFRNVFDFAYRRYLDVAQAETRAREAQIEASLERVRSVAMSMREPADMIAICRTISDQLKLLQVANLRNVQTAIINDETGVYINYEYFTQYDTSSILDIDFRLHPRVEEFVNEIKKAKDAVFTASFAGEEMREWVAYRKRTNQTADPLLESANSVHYYFQSIGPGALGLSTYAPMQEAETEIFRRFRNVFDLAYRRFVDIKQAEVHAKETLLELSLERVRARSMAMHRSDELVEASDVFFEQLGSLGIEAIRTGVGIFDAERETIEVWSRSHSQGQHGSKILGVVPKTAHPFFAECFDAWKRKEPFFAYDLVGDEVKQYYRSLSTLLSYPEAKSFNAAEVFYTFFFPEGSLNVIREKRLSEDELNNMRRFAGVFGLIYRRFLELRVAEAQAREARIEAALERVRSRAMAMHNSNDLSATSGVVFAELHKLGIETQRCGVVLLKKGTRDGLAYATAPSTDEESLSLIGNLQISGHPEFERQYDHWLRQENFVSTLRNDDLRSYYATIYSQLKVPELRPEIGDREEHGYYFPFSEGWFYAWTREHYSEEQSNILSRFKAIIELTFRRYLDLQKAEAQTREAQIEAALERVRSRTLAMQKSDELAETAAVLFRQLIGLGISPNRLYIAIIKDEQGQAEFWITDEDGSRVSSAFAANLYGNETFQLMLAGWQDGKTIATIDMEGEKLQEYFRYLNSLNVPFRGGLTQKRRVQTLAYFSKGFIGMASPDEQPEATTALLERFAAVFNLTFTRFNDLKLAEAQAQQAHLDLIQLQTEKNRAEEALSELRATQAQLLQQEKLASLGQLTAGIAHEIKNPLNFVNNFSSVSVELLDEAMQGLDRAYPELSKGEVPQLLDDVRNNLTKIIQHGTRADGIVKSMLQHSRGGSGKREPVDLNALVREYANLAFHGMRAGKNPINVDIALELSETIGEVSVIAEDFSRVIINLCQNAFDAMREKFNAGDNGGKSGAYLPKLTVRTRREISRVVVEIADNGPGIPDAIKDKILQPFFTTKKGTQGTGLGLSITHDIVKAHGGEMRIESNPDGGATFLIALPVETQ